jgi:hypothetical protein
MMNQNQRLGKHFVQIVLAQMKRRRPGILKELRNDVVQAFRFPDGDVHETPAGVVAEGIGPEHLHGSGQCA